MKIKDNLKEDTFNKPVLFVNDKVRVIVLPHNNNKHTMFVSFNNEQFVCFYNTGASSGGGCYNVSATDLTDGGRNYNFSYNKTQGFLKKEHAIEFDFLTIQKITNELDSEYTPYPNPTIIESAYIDDVSKDIYIVTRPQNDWGYDTFNIFVVKENNNFTRLKCNTVDRYRDGGTTFIYTDEGMLYSPTAFKKELKPTWTTINDVVSELIELDDPRNHLGKEILDLLGL